MKKAQVEGIGLVIIVILVLGAIFYFSTRARQADTTLDTYTEDKLATNYLAAVLETNTLCGPSIANLAIDCVKETAGRTTKYDCGEPACDYIAPLLQDLTNKTFSEQGYAYNLSLTYTHGEDELLFTTGEGCSHNQNRAAIGYFDLVIHPLPGNAAVTFQLCT